MEEELEVALNFLRKTITSTTKPIPQVIVILNLEEEVEVGPQPVTQEQPQPVPKSRPVEEKKLQQPMNSGKVFLQELFEEGPISNIIPRRTRLETRTMMK